MKKRINILLIILCVFYSASAQESTQIENNIDDYLTYFSGDNPGAVIAVFKKGEIVFNKAYGLANVAEGKQMSKDYLFDLGEISKAFTSLSVMKLVEKKKISLDDNLTDIFDQFPEYGNKIKVRNLLSHTSGLKSYHNENDVLAFLKDQKELEFEPGSRFIYSSSEYALLVKMIELKTGMSYKDYIKKNIFNKLKMSNTYFSDEIGDNDLIAKGHFKEAKVYKPELKISKLYGEQGIYTNAEDFAKWDKALYTNQLLKCESLERIFSAEKLTDTTRINYYGLGWVLMERNNTRYYWHAGAGNGYSNLLFHLPDSQLTILILTNRNDGYDFHTMAILIAKQFDKGINL